MGQIRGPRGTFRPRNPPIWAVFRQNLEDSGQKSGLKQAKVALFGLKQGKVDHFRLPEVAQEAALARFTLNPRYVGGEAGGAPYPIPLM